MARTGDQAYFGSEIGVHDKERDLITVHRTEDEVFSVPAMASFEGKPVTNDHPPEGVRPDNASAYDEALKAMGKTIDEVKKDPDLKEEFEQLQQNAVQFQLPPTPLSRPRGFGRYSRSSPVSKWRAPTPSSGLGII